MISEVTLMSGGVNKAFDKLFSLLSEYNDEPAQRRGIEEAKALKPQFLSILMAPYPDGGENCAKALSELPDEVLVPYLWNLLEWISDLNWPGALIILERLKRFTDTSMLANAVERCVRTAMLFDEQLWIGNIADLLHNRSLRADLPKDIFSFLYCRYQRIEGAVL